MEASVVGSFRFLKKYLAASVKVDKNGETCSAYGAAGN